MPVSETVFMFSGQGSQYYCMGRELYESSETFHDWMEYCSNLAAGRLGISLTGLLYQDVVGRSDVFDRTLYTFPAVFAINYSLASLLISEGIRPAILLGYSMGELVALTLSEAVALEDSLEIVVESARLIEARTQPAGMMVVLGSTAIASEYPELFHNVTIACRNYDENFVITGSRQQLQHISHFLSQKRILSQILPISHGFHSPFMDPVSAAFKSLVDTAQIRPMRTCVFSSVYARKINSRDSLRDYCWHAISKPVDFFGAVTALEAIEPHLYIDVGPSGTLANFVKNIIASDSKSHACPTLNQFGRDVQSMVRLKLELF